MKLLYCDSCQDVFKLDYDVRECKCGKVRGRYNEDGYTAVTNGKGRSLAIGSGSLLQAFYGVPAFEYKDKITFLAWVRPNDGPQNPRSEINESL
jgi:hypothetical protein